MSDRQRQVMTTMSEIVLVVCLVSIKQAVGGKGVHREWEFLFPVFPMGIPWEWEWTMYNLGTGMGMGISLREWEEWE